ncbi:hypothetical protein C1645_761404 [Glomus cerebriforme]|uniref:Uncharacterized protein n=1 Tax=Glomus cerebriforme TaxID=658196 RepID=A0A397S5G4_9GLOM|nr:hypothetical protein C1645_791925 [Glomus cerebriforme]RIA93836.1 hypothetical protein C1645_761404 [Glomus cerebriforme]
MSLNETIMGRNVFASQPIQPIQPAPAPRSKTRKSKRTLVESISAPEPKRPSQIFRENLLEQSVAMSLNETAMGRNVFASQTTQPTHEPEQERVESILAPKPKRPSQLFRENLLEQSVAMSLDNTIMGRNVFATHRQSLDINTSKIPRRRFSRRGSNAKFRKEKAEKNKKKKNTKDDADIINQEQQLKRTAVNPMVISKILGADELKTKVEEELRKKAVLHPPQPPPRRFTQLAAELRREVNVQKRSKSARPDKRSAKTEPSYRESIEPFPTHLSHESIHPPFTAYIIPSA